MDDTESKVSARPRTGESRVGKPAIIVENCGQIINLSAAGALVGARFVRCVTELTLALALVGPPACRTRARSPTVSRAGAAMGAVFSVAAWGRDSARLGRAADQAFDSVRLVDSLLSTYQDSSEIARINRDGGGRRVSPAFAAVLREALNVARRSSGAFDPTLRDWRGVTFDSARGRIALRRGLTLDFGGIATGYALDRALLALTGVADSAVLEIGGQYLIMSTGKPEPARGPGRRVGVVDPDNPLRALALIELPPGTWSVSTSSQVEQPGHIVDPRTGNPAARARSVTTMARTGIAADAWSTAFFVMGCDSALATAPRLDGVGVLCVDDRVRWSADLDGRVATDSAGSAATGPAPAPGRAPAGAPAPRDSTTRRTSPGRSRSGPRTS